MGKTCRTFQHDFFKQAAWRLKDDFHDLILRACHQELNRLAEVKSAGSLMPMFFVSQESKLMPPGERIANARKIGPVRTARAGGIKKRGVWGQPIRQPTRKPADILYNGIGQRACSHGICLAPLKGGLRKHGFRQGASYPHT
jgi:hypothetical protein